MLGAGADLQHAPDGILIDTLPRGATQLLFVTGDDPDLDPLWLGHLRAQFGENDGLDDRVKLERQLLAAAVTGAQFVRDRAAAAKRRRRSEMTATRGKSQAGALDDLLFALGHNYEKAFGRPPAVSRSPGSGETGGPFIRFACACFDTLGLRTTPAAMAQRLRRQQTQHNVQV
jgi:hypothetical protein